MKKHPLTFGQRIHCFWFRPVSAAGFGMMRVAWGGTLLFSFLSQASNVDRYYGPGGILPHDLISAVLRHQWRFSLLDYADVQMVHTLYYLLIVSLVFVTLGIGGRILLALSLALLYSFHEYATFTLDGGDTLLRLIGFLLLLAPCYRTFSVSTLRKRLQLIAATGNDQSPSSRTMPIWPYRLLLWQMIVLYVSSAILKLHGDTWLSGSAVAIALHHAHFARLSVQAVDRLSVLSPAIGAFTIISQLGWILLLLLPALAWIGVRVPWTASLKRALLLCGILVHGGILLTMDVGVFSYAVFTAYLGLLIDDDFRAIRATWNRKPKQPIIVLFDGRCGFCRKTIFLLSVADWLHHLKFMNYHDAHVHQTYAPRVTLAALNEEMHAVLRDGRIVKGFFAFRAVSWHIPVLWPIAPLLSLPGIPRIGMWVYRRIASHRIRDWDLGNRT